MLVPAPLNASTAWPQGGRRPPGGWAHPACRLHLRVRPHPRWIAAHMVLMSNRTPSYYRIQVFDEPQKQLVRREERVDVE